MQKDILSFEDVKQYTGFSESKLYKLTSTRQIPHYKPTGGKLFFKKEELDAWLLRNPVKTAEQLNIEAATYVTTHKK